MIVHDPSTTDSLDFQIETVTGEDFLREYLKGRYVCSHDRKFGKGELERDLPVMMGGELNLAINVLSYEDASWYAKTQNCVIPPFELHRIFFLDCLRQSIQHTSGGPLFTSTLTRSNSIVLIEGPFFEEDVNDSEIKKGLRVSLERLSEFRPLLRIAKPIEPVEI